MIVVVAKAATSTITARYPQSVNIVNLRLAPTRIFCYNTRMNNTTYNGYSNRATWNLILWISNDECAYTFFQDLYYRIGGDVIEDRTEQVERTCREWFGSTTPDDCLLDDVNWIEATETLDEDFEEIIAEILA